MISILLNEFSSIQIITPVNLIKHSSKKSDFVPNHFFCVCVGRSMVMLCCCNFIYLLYTGGLFLYYILDKSICHFRGVRSVWSLLFYFLMENYVASRSSLFAYDPFTCSSKNGLKVAPNQNLHNLTWPGVTAILAGLCLDIPYLPFSDRLNSRKI